MNTNRVLVIDTTYATIDAAVSQVFAAFPRSWSGLQVLVKPNVIGRFAPERHITTSPYLVRAVVRHLADGGARVVLGDNPGHNGYGDNQRSFQQAGLLDDLAPYYCNLGLTGEPSALPHSKIIKEINISRQVLECDAIISLPKFKTHQLCAISGAVKNSFGYVVGGDKANLHRLGRDARQFAAILVDIYALRPPDLVIMDAVVGMEGEGPSGKKLRYDVQQLLAAENGVSLDAVMTAMMGMKPAAVPMLAEAQRRGLGAIDLDEIEIIGPYKQLKCFKKPICYALPARFRLRNFLMTQFMFGSRIRLRANADLCTTCAACCNICPAEPKAAVMRVYKGKKLPLFDRAHCIECFCCLEVCPAQAIEKGSFLGKRLFKRTF